jgi:hypothetical protein
MGIAIEEVRTFLGTLSLGTITIGSMPASPDAMVTLYEYAGRVPEGRFGVTGVGWEKPAFQLIVRGAPHDYKTPRALAETAYRAVAAVQPGTVGGSTAEYLWFDVQQQPFPLRKDQNERYHFAFNFYAYKELS